MQYRNKPLFHSSVVTTAVIDADDKSTITNFDTESPEPRKISSRLHPLGVWGGGREGEIVDLGPQTGNSLRDDSHRPLTWN